MRKTDEIRARYGLPPVLPGPKPTVNADPFANAKTLEEMSQIFLRGGIIHDENKPQDTTH